VTLLQGLVLVPVIAFALFMALASLGAVLEGEESVLGVIKAVGVWLMFWSFLGMLALAGAAMQ
jgi:hypothetical protein